jgi:hypothetical protein
VSGGYPAPLLLTSADRLDGFHCRSEEQTIWLLQHARQAHARGGTCAGRYPQPVALLADVISRTAQLGSEVGCRGLLVHAESDSARDFYRHLIPEFEPSPTDPLHLVRLMKDILRTLG